MKHFQSGFARKLFLLLLVLSACAFSNLVLAQRGSRDTRARAAELDARLNSRELSLRHIADGNKPVEKQIKLALPQIKEDFERIQAVNNQLMQSVSKKPSLDLKLVTESVSEINKRAKRLKTNLAIPDADEKKNREEEGNLDSERLRAVLYALDDHIMSFVTSPLFQNTQTYDAQQAAKVRDDLDNVIEMSRVVVRAATRLKEGASTQ